MASRPTIPAHGGTPPTSGSGSGTPPGNDRPSRGERPRGPLIVRIPTSPLPFTPSTSDFGGYAQQQLGDLGTGTDGWDALFATPSSALDDDIAGLGDFDTLLSAAAFNAGDFAKTYYSPVDALLPALLEDGDKLNGTVQDPGQINGTVTIAAPPSPPDTGGGGDVGGGGSPGQSGIGNSTNDLPDPPWDFPVEYYF